MPQREKIDIIAEQMSFFDPSFQLQRSLISEFANPWEISPIKAFAPSRELSEYTSYTPGSFLEFDPFPLQDVSGRVVKNTIRYQHL